MIESFHNYYKNRINEESPPATPPPQGNTPPPDPSMGGGMGGAPTSAPRQSIKVSNVWDIIKNVLDKETGTKPPPPVAINKEKEEKKPKSLFK